MKEKFVNDKGFGKKYLKLVDYANIVLEEFREKHFVLTVRGVMYQMIGRGWLPVDEYPNPYGTITRLLRIGRDIGLIDWAMIEDRGRELHDWTGGDTSPQEAIETTANRYSECFLVGQPRFVMVVVEKEALLEIVSRACLEYSVSHAALRGDTSHTILYDLAKLLVQKREEGQEPIILMVTDLDPAGDDMERVVGHHLNMYARNKKGQEFELRRIGLTPKQARDNNLPPSVVKEKASRTPRYVKKYGTKECWELDALPENVLTNLIRTEVKPYIDLKKWNAAKRKSERNRAMMMRVAAHWDEIVEQYGDK